MFSFLARGRMAPQDVITPTVQGPLRVEEARLAAWALALGETRSSSDPPRSGRRPHRGMLPDVDWSNAVPVQRRSLLKIVVATLAARMAPLASLGGMDEPGAALPRHRGPSGTERSTPVVRRLAATPSQQQSRAA